MTTHRLGLVVHPTSAVSDVAGVVVRWAGSHGVDVVSTADASRVGPGVPQVDDATLLGTCDAVVSLGGDGTMLGALRLTAGRGIPVLGINLGTVGVLVEVEPDELPAALARLADQDFSIEEHPALRVSGPELEATAFNDLALSRTPGAGSVSAALAIDGRPYGVFRCDAVVVATPLGSTAYSYAAGGPVVSPGVAAVVVTPASPMSGISRSVVLAPRDALELEVSDDSGRLAVEADGVVVGHVQPGDVLRLHGEPGAGQVVRLDPVLHDGRSRLKLSLLDLPFRPDQLWDLAPERMRAAATSGRGDEGTDG